MILDRFPELNWLKSRIAEGFRSRTGYGGIPLESSGFPSVIIHTKARRVFRPDIRGPLSLFLNLSGTSICEVDRRRVVIPQTHFFLSNRGQDYTLEIGDAQTAETFNIHIGEAFSEGVCSALLTPAATSLERGTGQKARPLSFFNRLYERDAAFTRLLGALQTLEEQAFDRMRFEEILYDLLAYLLQQHQQLLQEIGRMPALKPFTRVELFRRLSFARDWMQGQSAASIDLDALAAEACLSKFHFLRLFRQVYGQTPYQYWQQLRLAKAEALLKGTRLPVQRIAAELGFEDAPSFSRFFFQRRQVYPSEFRL